MPPAARPFRVAVLLHAALILAQAAFAGQFLGGDAGWVRVHEANAGIIHLTAFVQLVLAIVVWRPGRGPGWPALASLALLLAEELQMGFGYARMLGLHVPLGVAIFGGTVAVLVGTRRLTRVDAHPQLERSARRRSPSMVTVPGVVERTISPDSEDGGSGLRLRQLPSQGTEPPSQGTRP